jgi:hypothetical protein
VFEELYLNGILPEKMKKYVVKISKVEKGSLVGLTIITSMRRAIFLNTGYLR